MAQSISVSDRTYLRLQECAEPFEDHTPEDVIIRLLDACAVDSEDSERPKRLEKDEAEGHTSSESNLSEREPRQRGVVVRMGDAIIDAVTVRDLYEQSLQILADAHRDELERLLPVRTSNQRYLVAESPVHPSGRSFVVPVEYDGLHMEAHKDYKTALAHLKRLASRLGVPFQYIE